MKHLIIVLGLVAALLPSAPLPARADSGYCDPVLNWAEYIQLTAVSGSPVDPRAEVMLKKQLRLCNSSKYNNLAAGYIYYATATMEHTKDVDWRDDLNLAITKLQKCQTDFYNQTIGARCETTEDEAIKDKVDWSE